MLGIYGGTFDPVHFGHLRTAVEIKERLGLRELRLLPARQPPHRRTPGATPQQRLEMLSLAIEGGHELIIDTRELERAGPSFMVDTLTSIRAESGAEPVCLIVGVDAFHGLSMWHRWQKLIDLAHLVVMQRPVFVPEIEGDLLSLVEQCRVRSIETLTEHPAGCLYFQEIVQLDISATRIRQLIQDGRNPRFLLPDQVLRYIHQNGLYR